MFFSAKTTRGQERADGERNEGDEAENSELSLVDKFNRLEVSDDDAHVPKLNVHDWADMLVVYSTVSGKHF